MSLSSDETTELQKLAKLLCAYFIIVDNVKF
jgi:hypothetical protein